MRESHLNENNIGVQLYGQMALKITIATMLARANF